MTDSDSYLLRGPLRSRQPQTYYPLPLLAGCVDFNNLANLKCPLSLETDEDVRHYQYAEIHRKLLRAARDRENHSIRLDEVLRELLPDALICRPEQYEGMCVGVTGAQFILSRFWRVPQRLSKMPMSVEAGGTIWEKMSNASWYDSYIIPEGREALKPDPTLADKNIMSFLGDVINRPWHFFYVTNIMDTNSVMFLLYIAHSLPNASVDLADLMLRYVDTLAEVIAQHDSLTELKTFMQGGAGTAGLETSDEVKSDEAFEALKAAGDFDYDDPKAERQACEIVRFFLYSAWSRSVTLLFYLVIGQQLEQGSSQQWSRYLAVQGLKQLEDLGNLGLGPADYRAGLAPDYLCNWSLELLRRSPSALCLDFRTLMRRYSEQFPEFPGRCNPDSTDPCEGDDPSSCGRFTQATTQPQTAHSATCDPMSCHLVSWNEDSYLSATGPRAVVVNDIVSSLDGRLRYTEASDNTMAISHVWAHGQGGRPESGINSCLHERYIKLAKRFECGSYWIDSACIPSEKSLRREAIGYINQIFSDSKVVLISDKDLQQIPLEDEGDDITWKAQIVVSVLLVCDWNVRAWTLLEAFRGSRSTYILCKDDDAISLVEVLRLVWRLGPIDLAVLIGSVQHLIPFAENDTDSKKSIEESAQMLSQRHTSKARDEVIIWGLLNMRPSAKGLGDAVKFWEETPEINTGFLVSSAPRLRDTEGKTVPGFSWAPSTPISAPQTRKISFSTSSEDVTPTTITAASKNHKSQSYSVRYPTHDGVGSYIGRIDPSSGLSAVWSYMDFDQATVDEHREEFGTVINPFEDWGVEDADPEEFVVENPDSVSLCRAAQTALDEGRLVRLIQPASRDGLRPYLAAKNRGDVLGATAAVVTSGDGGRSWVWVETFSMLDEGYWRWRRGEMLIA